VIFEMKGETIMKPSVIVVTIFLAIVSLVHLLRLIFQWKVMVNTFEMPLWASAIACLVTAVLAIWLWQENKQPS
jgi:hypothetical protein